MIPAFVTHYYEAPRGPLLNLSDLPFQEAAEILTRIRQEGKTFASKRATDYLRIRRELEERVRQLFIAKGGQARRERPRYFILGECSWLRSWYEKRARIAIPLSAFETDIISFTYRDTFPAMRYADGKPYRGQVFTLAELPTVVRTYGLPQLWNAEGWFGPDRYIEAQIWADEPLLPYVERP